MTVSYDIDTESGSYSKYTWLWDMNNIVFYDIYDYVHMWL